eukprot:gene4532-6746_t
MALPRVVDEDGNVNFDRLSSVMQEATKREDRYWRENDAKFRAVSQKVASYEEFEDIVKAAHIKPIKEDITQLQLGRSSWITTGRQKERNRRRDLELQGSITSELPPITDVPSFLRNWRSKQETRARYDQSSIIYKLSHLSLHVSSSHGLLGEFISAIDEHYNEEDSNTVCKLLKAFCRTQRFDLTLEFVDKPDLEKVNNENSFCKLHPRPHDPTTKEIALFETEIPMMSTLVQRVIAAGCTPADKERLEKGYALEKA